MDRDLQNLSDAKATLMGGGVVLLATDTVLGLVALPHLSTAVDKVYALKQRPRDKNLPIMVASQDQITALGAQITPSALCCLRSEFMPGPLTIALRLNTQTAPKWLSGRAECAIRIPNDMFLLDLLTEMGPLVVTSANLSGWDTPHSTKQVMAQLNGMPDYVIDGTAKSQTPSTLVNCSTDPAKIERIGAVTAAQITAILEPVDD